MISMRSVIISYLVLVLIIFLAFFALAIFADSAKHNHDWLQKSSEMILDMAKIAIGAAVGSLTTAAGAIAKQHASTDST